MIDATITTASDVMARGPVAARNDASAVDTAIVSNGIEDYALIGDTETAALVGKDGSIDWMCAPRFDSPACFAALLGEPANGRWKIAPEGEPTAVRRRYRPGSLVLETEFDTAEGTVRVIDCMPPRTRYPDVVRVVEGVTGSVAVAMELIVRFDYGSVVPWARRVDGGMHYIGGPDALTLFTALPTESHDFTTVARFTVSAGERVPFTLAWHPSYEHAPKHSDPIQLVEHTTTWWSEWSSRSTYDGPYAEAVNRSLLTLKALTYAPSGGIVAAPTTSLPEQLGGVRNWDYRYCWLRDATFTLYALMSAGYAAEARAWREWLLRAAAGRPSDLQIMYGVLGERRLTEYEVPWLCGYEGAQPVRIGNAASAQFQLDVYGEVMDALHQARQHGMEVDGPGWDLQIALMEYLEEAWTRPDEGIWEVRGPRRHFTHSKVMAWVAVDRAVRAVEQYGLAGPCDQWRALRDQIHADVMSKGYDADRQTFVQCYGSRELDASLLMVGLVGFLPPTDPAVVGTVAAIERELLVDGYIMRYRSETAVDGLPPGEGVFLPCTFWLVDNFALQGRTEEATALFERLLALRNDVGLLAEEYDPSSGRQLGNFP
jgi:GH15 family glucan-1,4-alpha-glucosidase